MAASSPTCATPSTAAPAEQPAGWPVLLALALGAFAIGTAEFAGMSMLPFYAREMRVDQPTAAHAVSLYALGVVVGAPLFAMLTARLARITAATLLIAGVAVASAGAALAPGYASLLALRFLGGLPHGAFFGQAALIAAAILPGRRAQAVALVMTGLTVATVIGAPLANLLGQTVGWRWGFAFAALAAAGSAVALALLPRPDVPVGPGDVRAEFAAIRRPQVLLTLATGAIGFGGLFAVYAYLPAIATGPAGFAARAVPWLLALFGVGMLVGNIAAGWAADRAQSATAIGLLAGSALLLGTLPLVVGSHGALLALIFGIALIGGLGPVLQTRLMDVAGEAQTLAAAAHHAAFNLANALGPWLAGLAITASGQWTMAGPVGAALSLAGLAVLLVAVVTRSRERAARR